ncbi:MAG: prolipoprotein diacylglyceryl transferase [Bacteroidales bacterium]|nr:prolipoprotein diacylglyceryl transferase [Bacteroidales bacterium]
MLSNLLFIHWNVNPVMLRFGSSGLRWYSLGFLLAFLLGYIIMARMFKLEKVDNNLLDSLVIYIFLAVLIGARLGHCLFYEPDYFLTKEHWIEMLLPIGRTAQGGWTFTGYQGLASHGAAIGILLALWLFFRKTRLNPLWTVDRLVIVIALGGVFIRLGNLMNSEIYGIQTSLPWGFVFERNGETVPKHPTQLYEAISYLIIFAVCLATYFRKKGALHPGRLFGWWLVALFGMRFLIEFVKEEQVAFEKGMFLDMGQWLSIPFILGGIVLVALSYKGKLPEETFIQKKISHK